MSGYRPLILPICGLSQASRTAGSFGILGTARKRSRRRAKIKDFNDLLSDLSRLAYAFVAWEYPAKFAKLQAVRMLCKRSVMHL